MAECIGNLFQENLCGQGSVVHDTITQLWYDVESILAIGWLKFETDENDISIEFEKALVFYLYVIVNLSPCGLSGQVDSLRIH